MKFGKHIDIHKMNIYNRKIRAWGQFFKSYCPLYFLINPQHFVFSLITRTGSDWKFCKQIDIHKMNIHNGKSKG